MSLVTVPPNEVQRMISTINLSIEEIGLKLGINHRTIHRWKEEGTTNKNLQLLQLLYEERMQDMRLTIAVSINLNKLDEAAMAQLDRAQKVIDFIRLLKQSEQVSKNTPPG